MNWMFRHQPALCSSAPREVSSWRRARRRRFTFGVPRTGAIQGRVVDETGAGVEGVVVSAFNARLRGELLTPILLPLRRPTTVDIFRLFHLRAGTYVLAPACGAHGSLSCRLAAKVMQMHLPEPPHPFGSAASSRPPGRGDANARGAFSSNGSIGS